MPNFQIKIDENDLKKVRNMLSDIQGAGERVTVRALNKTLIGVRTDASAAIREVVTAKKAAVDETIKISKATTGNSTAMIVCTGKPVALIDYSSRKTKRGVSVQVRKDRPRKVVQGAFIAKMKSGHEGVFWRKYHEKGAKKNKMEIQANRAGFAWSEKLGRFIPMGMLPREYRLPMEERYGPRIPDIMSNDPVMNKILDQAGQRLKDNLDHETDYELSKNK